MVQNLVRDESSRIRCLDIAGGRDDNVIYYEIVGEVLRLMRCFVRLAYVSQYLGLLRPFLP